MHTVGINAHLLSGHAGYRRAGIHHYIEQTLRHLPPRDDLRYLVYTGAGGALDGTPQLTWRQTRYSTERPPLRIAWEQVAWPVATLRHRVDLMHSLAFVTPLLAPAPTVVTVYDLSFMHYPDSFPRAQRVYLQTQTRRSCQRARQVLTISESGRQDVHRFFDVPLANITVVYPGVDAAFRPIPAPDLAAFRQAHQLPPRFVLHVGTLQPRKNIPTLLDAFALLADTDLALILVGGKGWLFDEIFTRVHTLGLQNRVRFMGYVPDGELPHWYSAADLLVMPSVYEGFGLPLAQAMACGTPVIASNVSSMPEVVEDAGRLFDPHSAESLAECIESVLNDSSVAATMGQRGRKQAEKFSWKQAGQKAADVYNRVLQQSR